MTAEDEHDDYERANERYQNRLARERRAEQVQDELDAINYGSASTPVAPSGAAGDLVRQSA